MPEINLLDLVNVVMLDLTKDGGELRVRGDKTFSLTYQMRVKIRCKLDLKLFPHDYQVREEDYYMAQILSKVVEYRMAMLKNILNRFVVGIRNLPHDSHDNLFVCPLKCHI